MPKASRRRTSSWFWRDWSPSLRASGTSRRSSEFTGLAGFSVSWACSRDSHAYVGAVVAEPGEVLVVPIESLRQLVLGDPVLGDLILRAYLMRRSLLIKLGSGFRIVGSCYSPDTKRLLEFAARNRLPHRFVDLDKDSQAEELLRQLGVAPEDTPVVVLREAEVLRNPDNAELARSARSAPPRTRARCLRPAGGRGRPGRSRRCRVRRLGRADSLRSGGHGHWRPGRDDVTHRELSRLPIRDFR